MPDKISKKIKFALFLKNGEEVRTLEEFHKYFDMREAIRYFLGGKLSSWLRSHNYPEEKCRAIEQLKKSYDAQKSDENYVKAKLVEQLSQILEISESATTAAENIESVQIIEQILKKEREIKRTVELGSEYEKYEILKDVERIARTQIELDKIIEKSKRQKNSTATIYLVSRKKPYQFKLEDVFYTNLRFIGLNQTSLDKISSKSIPEIKIFYESANGKKNVLLEEVEIKNFLGEPQNKNKFNNLIIKTRKVDYFAGKETSTDLRIPKTAIKSANTDINKTGIEIAEDKLIQYLDAGFPLIYIDNFEEDKADEIIRRAAVSRHIFEWSEAEGLLVKNENGKLASNFDRQWSLKHTLKFFIDDFRGLRDSDEQTKFELQSSILVLKDLNEQLNDFEVVTQLKYLSRMIYNGQIESCNIIIVSSNWNIPPSLEHIVTILKIDLTEKEIYNLIENFCKNQGVEVPAEMLINKFVEAFKGLSEFTIISILSLAFSRDGELNSTDMDLIFETKKQMIQKTNILEMVEVTEKDDDIGGLEILKGWLRNKEKIFKNMSLALKCGIKIPKGILIVGMPGCGKTLTAKVTASMFDMPLLRLDMGRISPCILWFDELEKAFAGVGGDGGAEVATRLFGTFLTWMQEKTKPVFVVATANNLSQLPPELLRKGRFDEIFYVGTPNAVERKKIFEIYIDKVKNNKEFIFDTTSEKEKIDIEKMVQNSLGLSSADIAGIVSATVENSFVEFLNNVNEKNSADENKKPKFSTEMVNEVIKDTHKMSGWQQIKRIYQTYMQHDYKNASEHDTEDFLYWFKLRAINLKDLPGQIFSVSKNLFIKTYHFIQRWAKEILSAWSKEIDQWDKEEQELEEKGLPQLKWGIRFERSLLRVSVKFFRKVNDFFEWISGNDKDNDNEQKKVNPKGNDEDTDKEQKKVNLKRS